MAKIDETKVSNYITFQLMFKTELVARDLILNEIYPKYAKEFGPTGISYTMNRYRIDEGDWEPWVWTVQDVVHGTVYFLAELPSKDQIDITPIKNKTEYKKVTGENIETLKSGGRTYIQVDFLKEGSKATVRSSVEKTRRELLKQLREFHNKVFGKRKRLVVDFEFEVSFDEVKS